MKLLYSIIFLVLLSFTSFSQDKKDIAKIYFKRAEKSYASKDFEKTDKYLSKAITYFGGIENEEVAIFGANFYFEQQDFKKAKEYLTFFFKLNKNNNNESYSQMLLLYTDTLDAIENPDAYKKEKIVTPKVITDKIKGNNIDAENTEINQDNKESFNRETAEEESEVKDIPFSIIEKVPIFPGCSGNIVALKNCFSKNVQIHFSGKFNTDLPNTLGLSAGKKRVFIGFSIDKTGNVVNIIARAPHPKIKEEVIRVMKLLPTMTPGRQRGKPVGVKYSIPFTLIVEGDDKKK
jgi:hypothetical protein